MTELKLEISCPKCRKKVKSYKSYKTLDMKEFAKSRTYLMTYLFKCSNCGSKIQLEAKLRQKSQRRQFH